MIISVLERISDCTFVHVDDPSLVDELLGEVGDGLAGVVGQRQVAVARGGQLVLEVRGIRVAVSHLQVV